MVLSLKSELLRLAGQRLACLKVHLCAFIFALLICNPSTFAIDEPQLLVPGNSSELIPLDQALETRGDLSLQDTTIQKALFTIGATWKVNIVVGKDVEGTVSCIYTQAPLREVLDAILLANGYSYRPVGQSLVVQRAQEVGSANPLFQSAAISITHTDLNEVVEGAKLLLSSQGQLQSLESSNSVLVVDFADRVESIRNFIKQMDSAASQSTGGIPAESYKRLQVAYFHTHFIPVDNTKAPITAVLSASGKVATMPAENRLVVVDYASNIEMVGRVLKKIDRPRPQVRITALIYDISLQDLEDLGFNWNSEGKGNTVNADGVPDQVLGLDSTTLVPFAPGVPGSTLTVKSLTQNFDLRAIGVFLQNAKDARLLADPHVTVEENAVANMDSVTEIPFQQLTESSLGGQIGTTAFKKVGIKLQVTPQIASDGTVKMLVSQEFSRVNGFTENDNQPIIDARIASTSVRVANGQTVVIGGLRQRSDTGDFNGVPFLKEVPLVGPLFRSRSTNVRESELIVFIRPEIVDFDQVMSYRESLANDTGNFGLDAIPLAEGCQKCPNGGQGHGLLQLPPVDGDACAKKDSNLPSIRQAQATSDMRPDFDNRYRSEKNTSKSKTPTIKRLFNK